VHGVVGAGTGILRTIDFVSVEEVDAQLVADYVNEAVSRLDYFKAHEHDQIDDHIKQWLAEVGRWMAGALELAPRSGCRCAARVPPQTETRSRAVA
jgi:hypothetical protein